MTFTTISIRFPFLRNGFVDINFYYAHQHTDIRFPFRRYVFPPFPKEEEKSDGWGGGSGRTNGHISIKYSNHFGERQPTVTVVRGSSHTVTIISEWHGMLACVFGWGKKVVYFFLEQFYACLLEFLWNVCPPSEGRFITSSTLNQSKTRDGGPHYPHQPAILIFG